MITVKLDGFCECIECGKRIDNTGYVFKGGDIDVYGCKECAEQSYASKPSKKVTK